jgi:hypothetical protein
VTQNHDEIESEKIPRLRETSLDVFKHTIFNNLKLIDNEIHGLHNTSKLLSKIFDIDPHLSEIELGKLIKNKLKYKIKS